MVGSYNRYISGYLQLKKREPKVQSACTVKKVIYLELLNLNGALLSLTVRFI